MPWFSCFPLPAVATGPPSTKTLSALAGKVKEQYGDGFNNALLKVWREEALPAADKEKLKYFLGLKETSPQAEPFEKHAETTEDHMIEFLYKMVLYAPEEWYEVFSGLQRPADKRNDFGSIGVAFDASSRLRRAGVEHYHWKQTDRMNSPVVSPLLVGYPKTTPFHHITAGSGQPRVAVSSGQLPPRPKDTVRVVAVSDTHHFHRYLEVPQGDILIHAGDLCYEESRSADGAKFDGYVNEKKPLSGEDFDKWFDGSGLHLLDGLRWLGEQKFAHRVLIGGNHDYILEQLGPEHAERLCERFGITYLYAKRGTKELSIEGASRPVTVWGSGLSFSASLSASRAIKSGNVAFQLPDEEAEKLLRVFMPGGSSTLTPRSVDIMMTHTPPGGCLLGKKGQAADALSELIKYLHPSLYACGHAHRPNDPFKDTVADIDGVVGVNASCLGVWNHLHGLPIVVDLKLPGLTRS